MFLALNKTTDLRWRPTASLKNQQLRAKLYAEIRQFFAHKNVLEVETPLLCQHTVTDIHLHSFQTIYRNLNKKQNYYLQTSPEYAMKRLLADGSGPIYQIGKAFRNEESGSQHNPEFTLLEWYRPNFTYNDLIDEIDELLQLIIPSKKAVRKTYQALFMEYLSIDPLQARLEDLQTVAAQQGLENAQKYYELDTLLQFLFTHAIEPKIGFNEPLFVYDFPASQAALAKIHPQDPRIALRFEIYIEGIECGNGFEELTNATEQRQRFENDNLKRTRNGLPPVDIDSRLLMALEAGLPNCSGVAIGLDRLLMIKAKTRNICDIIAFPVEIA